MQSSERDDGCKEEGEITRNQAWEKARGNQICIEELAAKRRRGTSSDEMGEKEEMWAGFVDLVIRLRQRAHLMVFIFPIQYEERLSVEGDSNRDRKLEGRDSMEQISQRI